MGNVRANKIITIDKSDYKITIRLDDSPYHEAKVDGYVIHLGNKNVRYSTPLMSIDDLKELRKVIRKCIKEREHGC